MMKLFVGSVIGFFVLIGFISSGDGFTITTGTVPNKPKINKQLKLLNTSIETALGSAFLTQATKVAASQDPTIRDAMVAVYGMPFTGLLCIVTNYQSILNKMESQTFTVSGIISILKNACPLNSGTLTSIETSIEAVGTKFQTTTPTIIAGFPQSFKTLVSDGVDAAMLWSNSTAPNTALTTSYNKVVSGFAAITKPDCKKASKLVPALKPYCMGKLKKTVTATLKNFAASVAKLALQNSATLSKQVTTLVSGFTTGGGTVSQWAVKGVNKMTITPTIKSDSTVTSMAQSVVTYGSKYGPVVIWSDNVQKYIKAFVAGKFNFAF